MASTLSLITPMHPSRARESFHRHGWVYERKDDGWRMLALKDGARVRLVSRHGVDHSARFVQLAAAIAKLPAPTLVLDGEVCVFDQHLTSQFHLLGDPEHGEIATPPVYIAFDLVYARGRDRRAQPLRDRRVALEDEIAGAQMIFPSLRLDGDGHEAWAEVKRNGWEGMVAKDDSSRYVGGRSRSWVKVKVRREGRFVVIGLDIADGHASSLLLAARRGRELSYVGRVEWGVTRGSVEQIVSRTTRRVTPPCRDAERTRGIVWVEPRVVVEVNYSEIMVGRVRDPVFRGVVG